MTVLTLVVHLARKPVEGTVAQNALVYGTGGLNIDACRIGLSGESDLSAYNANMDCHTRYTDKREKLDACQSYAGGWKVAPDQIKNVGARWPANLILEHHEKCRKVGVKRVRANPSQGLKLRLSWFGADKKDGEEETLHSKEETIDAWQCEPTCPCRMLDEQSGVLVSGAMSPSNNVKPNTGWSGGSQANRVHSIFIQNTGGASRFFKSIQGDPE